MVGPAFSRRYAQEVRKVPGIWQVLWLVRFRRMVQERENEGLATHSGSQFTSWICMVASMARLG